MDHLTQNAWQNAESGAKKSEELSKRLEDSEKAITDALEAAPVNGLPKDEAMLEEYANYEHAIFVLEEQKEETDDAEERVRFSAQIDAKQNEYDSYRASVLNDVETRFADWADDCLASIAAWTPGVKNEGTWKIGIR